MLLQPLPSRLEVLQTGGDPVLEHELGRAIVLGASGGPHEYGSPAERTYLPVGAADPVPGVLDYGPQRKAAF